jgi:uncharacterized protein YjbI with pentapeptide repeats
MWTDLRECDFTGSIMEKTVFVEAKLQGATLNDVSKGKVYLDYANLEGTIWGKT